MDKHGRPTMRSVDCSCSVASADIRFHGGAAWIYNMFSGMLEGKLKDVVGGGNGIVRGILIINTYLNHFYHIQDIHIIQMYLFSCSEKQ